MPCRGLDDDHQMGSLLLVGDPKQAIYRWRGDNEQFLKLLKKKVPFSNYFPTSLFYPKITGVERAIVDFNNQFFSWVGARCEDPEQKQMFEQQTQQDFNSKKRGAGGGFAFIEKSRKKKVQHLSIKNKLLNHSKLQNPVVFCGKTWLFWFRKKEQAALIAEGTSNRRYPHDFLRIIVIGSSIKVNFLISLIRVTIDPDR